MKAATITRLPWPCRVRTWVVAASNTLRPSPARSSAKLRPTRPPNERSRPLSPSLGLLEGRHVALGAGGELRAPVLAREEHGGRRHRLVGRGAEGQGLEALDAGLVVVRDQLQTLGHGLVGQVVEGHGGVADVVEQRLQALVEQRQPVLHAGIALAGADGLVEGVLAGGGAEGLDVGAAEALLGDLAEGHLAHGHQGEALNDLARALRVGIEGLDVLQRVAEEVEPHGARAPRREEVEDAAAHGILAGLHDGAGALVAGEREPLGQLVHVEALAGGDVFQRAADEIARGQALQDGVDGGQHDGRALAGGGREAGERGDAGGHDLGVGADAVVGHRVPGRQLQDAHLGGEEPEALGQRLEAAVVARHMQEQRRGGRALLLGQPRQHQGCEPFRHAGQRLPHGALSRPWKTRSAATSSPNSPAGANSGCRTMS